ncbi:gamma-tubulin complex component 4-like isoform X2 [Magallana gigas]|uniref:gamma-tubulin complex component 4-like isoform X2 n=1 Tax=Magallana gigas TaxID=29159 RepID=UPI00333E9E2E
MRTTPELVWEVWNFQRQSNLLFTVLSSVWSHNASPHLAQLLLRLDYNYYFSVAGGQLGRQHDTEKEEQGIWEILEESEKG